MTFKKLPIKKSKFYPIVVLERVLPHELRHILYKWSSTSVLLLIAALVSFLALEGSAVMNEEAALFGNALVPKVTGIILLISAFGAVVFLLETFFRSFYFRKEDGDSPLDSVALDIEALKIVDGAKRGDMTKAFLLSAFGRKVLRRSGIDRRSAKKFLKKRMEIFLLPMGKVVREDTATASGIAKLILRGDKEFSDFLFGSGVREKEFIGAVRWVARESAEKTYREKWWSREYLGRIKGVGRGWSFGEAYLLNRYGRDMLDEYNPSMGTRRNQEERKQLEIILSRAHEANALLVGEEGVGKMSVIYDFAWEIAKETAVPALRHKRVVYLDTGVLIAATKEKTGFEAELLEILQQAENAGNVILALGNLPSFIINAKSLGSDVMGLLGPYLESSSLQMIAISDTENFHRILGRDAGIMTHFEKIMMEEPDTEKIFVILEDVARDLERQSRIFFTYGAISEAVTSAENYFSDAVMPDKAIDLLMETVPLLAQKRKHLVRREDILELVESKTHIPVGKIKEAEKEKLMNLEELLHRRIIGQDEAVFAVSNAMRRSRTGIRDPQKPIGTFLFLGPTGVGKTETAKALASVFFGDDDAILRLDMSEYQTTDALSRLIGSFEEEKIGTLSTLLREKPYGVLLLDEFEKTNPEVLDLFLQILDEGFFSDMRGKRVNARNIIFIATSNAGSDIIWEAVKAGRKLSDLKDEIIEQIIKRGIFKPELLNRFDATVLFHPLRPEDLKKITVLMLGKLQKRLREKGVDLVVNDVLTNYVATQGYNPAFGARPMNRVIQERVEQLIADKLLSGELPRGSKVELTEAELSS